MSNSLTLYIDAFWISPYAFSCHVAMREKGLAFEVHPVALQSGEQRRPEYRDQTITGKVPALAHDGFWLAESSAIIEYLDDVFPAKRALPENPRDRARARQVMAWLRSDLLPLRAERPTTTLFYERTSKPLSDAGAEAARKLEQAADLLISEGSTSLFSSWCAADSDLAFMLQRLLINGHDLKPKLRAFADAQWKRPSVREWVEHKRQPYVAY